MLGNTFSKILGTEFKGMFVFFILILGIIPFGIPYLTLPFIQSEVTELKRFYIFHLYPVLFISMIGYGCLRLIKNKEEESKALTWFLISLIVWLPMLSIILMQL